MTPRFPILLGVLCVLFAITSAAYIGCVAFRLAQGGFDPPQPNPPQWVMHLYVGSPPRGFVGPMPYWQPSPDAPRIYYAGPSLSMWTPGSPPTPGTMELIVTYPTAATAIQSAVVCPTCGCAGECFPPADVLIQQ